MRPIDQDKSSTSPGVRGYTPGTLGACAGPRGVNLATTRQPHRVHAGAGPRAPSGRTGGDALRPAPPSSTLASPLSAPARGLPPAYGRACRRSARSAGARRGTLPHTRSVASRGGCAGAPVAPGRPSRLHMRGAGGWLQLLRQTTAAFAPRPIMLSRAAHLFSRGPADMLHPVIPIRESTRLYPRSRVPLPAS